MGKKIKYLGKEFEVQPWGGTKSVDQIEPVQKKLATQTGNLRGSVVSHHPEEGGSPKRKTRMPQRSDVDEEMKEAPASEGAVALISSGGGSKKSGHETQVISQTPHYGLPECATVIMPFTAYFAWISPANVQGSSNDMNIFTTNINTIISEAVTDPTGGNPFAAGLWGRMIKSSYTGTWTAPLLQFPTFLPTITEKPAYHGWYTKMYEVYNVNKCEWEMLIHNPISSSNADIIIGVAEEAYPIGGASGNTVPAGTTLQYTEQFPDVKFKVIKSNTAGAPESNFGMFSGTYYPGQANKNVRNDEDVKTWTATNASPTLTEGLHFKIFKGPFNEEGIQGVNVRLHMRFTVQFRDLKTTFRYVSATTPETLNSHTDVIQAPSI